MKIFELFLFQLQTIQQSCHTFRRDGWGLYWRHLMYILWTSNVREKCLRSKWPDHVEQCHLCALWDIGLIHPAVFVYIPFLFRIPAIFNGKSRFELNLENRECTSFKLLSYSWQFHPIVYRKGHDLPVRRSVTTSRRLILSFIVITVYSKDLWWTFSGYISLVCGWFFVFFSMVNVEWFIVYTYAVGHTLAVVEGSQSVTRNRCT